MLEDSIQSVLQRDGKHGTESTVVALHCAQMKEWGVRGGNIEWRPIQDPLGDRLKLFSKLSEHNQLPQRLNHVMDCFTCRGEVLWYFQPDPENPGLYRIEFFVGGQNHSDPQFKVFYKPGGREIDRVIIRYSYEQETPGAYLRQSRWVRLVISTDWIEQSEGLAKPQFDWMSNAGGGHEQSGRGNQYPNPFKPYLPIIISKNNGRQLGQQGSDDFYWIQSLIETHEGLVAKAHKNLRMFSSPILVTTRSANEVMAQASGWSNTWASANRYVDLDQTNYSGSTNSADVPSLGMQRTPFGMMQANTSEGSLDTIFGNMGESERFAFIQADPVSGDQNLWIKQIRESIHWILGGIDPLSGLSSGATFGEIKTLFGRVQNTADQKAHALYGSSGIAMVLERILWREEQVYKRWLFEALAKYYPKQFADLTSPDQLTDEICQKLSDLKSQGILALGDAVGQLPQGDRSVTWRYTRDVFQNTTREELDRSIAARNEREDGLSQEWVLRKQYPNLTDQEIRNAMSGFSPRVVQNAALGIQSMLQIFQQFMQLPDPENPKKPWALSLGLPELLGQAILTLRKEISYGQPIYEPAEEPQAPTLADITARFSLGGNSVQPISSTPELPLGTSPTAATAGFYRPGNENPQLRGSVAGAANGIPPWTVPGAAVSVFGGAIPGEQSAANWGAGTPLGRAGDIDPSLLPLVAEYLRKLGIQ